MASPDELRVIIYRDGDIWVAQCLEFDIGAQAPDRETLQVRLSAIINAEIRESVQHHGEPFAGIDPAPDYFREMWENAAPNDDIGRVRVARCA